MPVAVTITIRNDNPHTISNTLARKLGRPPTDKELRAEVLRILFQHHGEHANA